jgi:monoamine oxidase
MSVRRGTEADVAGAMAVVESSAASASSAASDVDVVVVGAGISGLVTATRLIEAGITCAVLESQNRVGGRLFTHRSPAGRFDLGATWFWPGESRVASLIDELQVPTHAHHLAGDAMYHVPGGAQRIDGNPMDVVSGRFSDGAASLAERLAAPLGDAVSLRTPVQEIDHHGSELQVRHVHGSLSARHVVLALPPSLAVHHITFRPALADQLRALATATPVWMGTVAKAVVVYPAAFWRDDGLAGAAVSHVGHLRELHDMSGPDGTPAALFGFAPLAAGVPTPTEQEIVAQLVEIFGPAAATPTEVIVKDWRSDVHTVPPGAAPRTAMGTYGHPRYQEPAGDGRIHWASTETAPSAPGHIEGAIAAAERAVEAITTDRAGTPATTARHPRGDQ